MNNYGLERATINQLTRDNTALREQNAKLSHYNALLSVGLIVMSCIAIIALISHL